MSMDPKVLAAAERISPLLDQIKAEFIDGYKITLICRNPNEPDGSQDFIMTDDSIQDAIAAAVLREQQQEKH